MANRRHVMDLAMVLDRVENILAVDPPPKMMEAMRTFLMLDVVRSIAHSKCADPDACCAAVISLFDQGITSDHGQEA